MIVSREESAIQPDLCADGNTLVFSEPKERDFNIHSRDLVSGEYTVRQAVEGVYEKQPQLASETGEVVYTGYDFRNGRPADTNLFLDRGNGAPAVKLTESNGGRNTFPDLSENGHTLVWVWFLFAGSFSEALRLYFGGDLVELLIWDNYKSLPKLELWTARTRSGE